MTTSVRLDPETEALIDRLARRRKQTRSAVIREAIGAYAEREGRSETPYELLAPWIGCIDSGGLDRSRRTGTKFRAVVEEKRRARRPR